MWGLSVPRAWPAVLVDGDLKVRPISRLDQTEWLESRGHSAAWLGPWEASVPEGTEPATVTFADLVRRLRRSARLGTTMPFVIEVDGRLVGQVTVNNIVRGSAQFASIGYWIDERWAGRGLVPRAVALVIDHCFTTAGLHRVEICVRPENTNSLRVVEKLGLHEVGLAPRYLHIDGDWRDHRIYAVTREEVPQGMLARLRERTERGE